MVLSQFGRLKEVLIRFLDGVLYRENYGRRHIRRSSLAPGRLRQQAVRGTRKTLHING